MRNLDRKEESDVNRNPHCELDFLCGYRVPAVYDSA